MCNRMYFIESSIYLQTKSTTGCDYAKIGLEQLKTIDLFSWVCFSQTTQIKGTNDVTVIHFFQKDVIQTCVRPLDIFREFPQGLELRLGQRYCTWEMDRESETMNQTPETDTGLESVRGSFNQLVDWLGLRNPTAALWDKFALFIFQLLSRPSSSLLFSLLLAAWH